MRRRTWAEALLVSGALVTTRPGAAEDAGMRAELSCRPEAAPGRVLCELKCTANPGKRLIWADALVKAAPELARPLRSRVTPERFSKETGEKERVMSLAFVAHRNGAGTITVQARAVVCSGQGGEPRCWPVRRDVHAELRVGTQ